MDTTKIEIENPIEWEIMDRLVPVILFKTKGCIVDIGIGSSTEILAKHAIHFGVKQYSCDTDGRKCERYHIHDNQIMCHMNSISFAKEFDDTPAIVFLDGKHDYYYIKEEAALFLDKLVPGGVMFIHDTLPMEIGYEKKMRTKGKELDTYKLRWDLEKLDTVNVFTWPYGVGFSMVLKKDLDVPFYRK